jgi:hypothetical protein
MKKAKKDAHTEFIRQHTFELLRLKALEYSNRWMAEVSIKAANHRRKLLEIDSCLKIQCGYRGFAARCELERRRQVVRELTAGPFLTRIGRLLFLFLFFIVSLGHVFIYLFLNVSLSFLFFFQAFPPVAPLFF